MIAFRVYNCSCGFKAWAMDNIKQVSCKECGKEVKTEIQSKEDGEKFTKNLLKNIKSA